MDDYLKASIQSGSQKRKNDDLSFMLKRESLESNKATRNFKVKD